LIATDIPECQSDGYNLAGCGKFDKAKTRAVTTSPWMTTIKRAGDLRNQEAVSAAVHTASMPTIERRGICLGSLMEAAMK
jgi:hypothetical protein